MDSSNVVTMTNTPSDDADLRDQVRRVMASDKRMTQAACARETGISATVLNRWLSGLYNGDNDAVDAKLRLWLDSIEARRAEGAQMPVAPAWVATPTSARIVGTLSYAQAAGDIAVVYGGAGLGKTSSIKHYCGVALNVWHVTMTPATASVVTSLEEIAEAVGAGSISGGAAKLHRAICRRVRGTGGLLVVDEAQHLSTAALDQIRSIHDATEIGIALVGNQEVYARMTGGNRAVFLDRLYSRIGKRLALRQSSEGDIDALLGAWDINDGKCRKNLLDIARRPGALRTLTKVLRLAAMHAQAEGRTVCCEDVARANRELGAVE